MAGGLGYWVALVSLGLGLAAALAAYLTTADPKNSRNPQLPDAAQTSEDLSKRALRRLEKNAQQVATGATSYRSFWMWTLAACFAIFAARSFCWLLFQEGEDLRIQSPNNLGDLALHITYIKNFANGVSIWPDNPIYPFGKLQYPAGIDLFNALLCCVDVDLMRGLIWVGLLASVATFYAFFRWSGEFGVAGFLFNGGLVALPFFTTWRFDPQWEHTIVWKSIPLAMFVTQRGLLYAIPAGLLLLWHWREKFFRAHQGTAAPRKRAPLPFWIELSLYASMPLFHLHTFIALSIVLLFLFAFGDSQMRKHTAILVASALLPATFLSDWLAGISKPAPSSRGSRACSEKTNSTPPSFSSGSRTSASGFRSQSFLIGLCVRRWNWKQELPENLSFLLPALAIFLIAVFVKLAAWEWDNTKILIWAYFLVLPFLWTDLIAKWTMPVRVGVCFLLFGSGFVTLFGGLGASLPGYVFANRGELYSVAVGVRKVPVEGRFAAFPIYNHPLLLEGRKVALGYPGHVWTQGFDYDVPNAKLRELMLGAGDWRKTARSLNVRYLFWGREEKINYATSTRPWERTTKLVNSGNWGAVYDLESESGDAGRSVNQSALSTTWPAATTMSLTSASTSNCNRSSTCAIFLARKIILSSGRTACRNFIVRIPESKKRGFVPFASAGAAAIPAVCASASVRITPGTRGSPGKCPANMGSSRSKIVAHCAETPGARAMISRTNTNGGRCGKPRSTTVFDARSAPFVTRYLTAAQPLTK